MEHEKVGAGDYVFFALAVPATDPEEKTTVAVVFRQDRWAHDNNGREPVPVSDFEFEPITGLIRCLRKKVPEVRAPISDLEHRKYFDLYI